MKDKTVKAIEKEAIQYYKRYDKETLFEKLVEEWQNVEADSVSTRGMLSDYLKELVQQIVKGIMRNKDLVAATAGIITSEVLNHMQNSGYDTSLYRPLIAVLVAVVAKSLVGSMKVIMSDKDRE